MQFRAAIAVAIASTAMFGAVGCGSDLSRGPLASDARMDRGMVVVLPGIEGEGAFSFTVQHGLNSGGVDEGIPLYRWGWPVPVAGLLVNQVDVDRARAKADELAAEIVRYKGEHPGRPVHLVGHSGGAAVAVFTAEALPDGETVDGVVLLSPSLSAGYDLGSAMRKTRKGVVHFWSPGDVALLQVGTRLFGNLDGVNGAAAGAVGFEHEPAPNDTGGRLYQIRWQPSFVLQGNLGGHFSTTDLRFVANWVAPWIVEDEWPPPLPAEVETQPASAPVMNATAEKTPPQGEPRSQAGE